MDKLLQENGDALLQESGDYLLLEPLAGAFTGTLTSGGTLAKNIWKSLAGTLTPAGVMYILAGKVSAGACKSRGHHTN